MLCCFKQLNEDACRFAPAWHSSYKPICTGVDCTIPSVYESLTKQAGSAGESAFMKMQTSPVEKFDWPRAITKSYPWTETGFTLASAVAAPTQQPFTFTLDKTTPQTFTSSYWGSTQLPPHDGTLEFMRKVDPNPPAATTMSDNPTLMTLLIIQQQQQAQAAHNQQALLNIKFMEQEGFKLTYSAQSIHMVPVKPGTWFDDAFIDSQKTSPLLQQNGKMPLVPVAFYVATKPRVEFQVAEQHVAELKKVYETNGEFSIIVGGNHFKSIQTTPLAEGEEASLIANDTLTVEEVVQEDEQVLNDIDIAEAVAEVLSEIAAEESANDNEAMSEFTWLQAALIAQSIAQTQQAAANAAAQLQKLYKVTIQSNSDIPQIIGVVSRVLSK